MVTPALEAPRPAWVLPMCPHDILGIMDTCPVAPRFWNTGQPDNWHQNIGGAEECVHLKSKSLHSWNDGNCTRRYRWVCKKALG